MAKRNLSSLLDDSISATSAGRDKPQRASAVDAPAKPTGEPDASAPVGADTAKTAPVRSAPARRQSPPASGPRYLELDRKELRIRGDQADDLSTLTRQLNRLRKGAGDRITDNTLIRVSIDLLLRERENLRGTTESELFSSLLPD